MRGRKSEERQREIGKGREEEIIRESGLYLHTHLINKLNEN